jgi:myo-inositol-1-phosphate synthase
MAPHATGPYTNGSSTLNGAVAAPIHPTAARCTTPVIVASNTTAYSDDHITAKFEYRGAHVVETNGAIQVTPTVENYEFRTERKVQKTG